MGIVSHSRLQNRLQNLSDKFNNTKTPTVCETVGVFSIQQEKLYLVGAARILLARKMITTSASAAKNILGMPTSSAKPVLGKAVDVGITVWVVLAICVNAAPTVAVAGTFGVKVGPLGVTVGAPGVPAVLVAWAMTGVLVGGRVAVAPAVAVSALATAV